MQKLKKILKDIPYTSIRGSKEVQITGITSDSKLVSPGNLFLAKKGCSYDGTDFIQEAIEGGAVAIVTDIFDPFLGKVVQVIHSDVASIEADIAAAYYQYPAKELITIGITGTNGKTTSAYLIRHILKYAKKYCGLISTVEYSTGKNHMSSSYTTPNSIFCQKLLREMVKEDCSHAVLEVSSHGLEQDRIKHIPFSIALFTNISHEHLDYHETFENYLLAKKKLFKDLSTIAVINIDSPYGYYMSENVKGKIISYAVEKKADFSAENIQLTPFGTDFSLNFKEKKISIHSPLIGNFNIQNMLAAIATTQTLGVDIETISQAIKSFKGVPGRLEPVLHKKKIQIFVDYAHTEDALKNVLLTLLEIKKGKIITLFGCGGDRDKEKREKMAEISAKLSDFVIITTDNPRNEDPEKICKNILCGIPQNFPHLVELDRKKAIEKAIEIAEKDDVILIAGKGHEKEQIFANKTLPFDDKIVAKEIYSKSF